MSYVKTNWKTGDIVTSAKMNKIEDGIANNDLFFVVHATIDTSLSDPNENPVYAGDCTPRDIIDALEDGKIVVVYSYINYYGDKMIQSALLSYNWYEDDEITTFTITDPTWTLPESSFLEEDLDNPIIFGYNAYDVLNDVQ